MPFVRYSPAFTPLTIAQAPDASNALGIEGLWIVETGNGKVEIKDCGDGTPCGTLVWVNKANGKGDADINNADSTLRDRPLLGSAVFWEFKKKGDGW